MHSTIEQLHRVCNKIRESFEKKEYCSAVFLDVQQAFDRVWHKGLLYKLKMVLPHTYYSLLESYLSERLFRVKCKEAHSKLYDIKAGVPQGSVLGPSLYSLYTADIPQSRNVTTATYADDTAALSSSKTPEQASKQLQEYLGEMDNWLEKWKIKASASKSVHITFTLRQGNCPPVKLGGEALKHVDNVKYLGMHLDRKQTWKHHIQQKRNAINLKTRELEWLINPRSRLSLENKLLVYTSILKPLWTYGIELWGTASTSNIQVIQRCQNAILRKISNAPLFTKTSEIHEYLKVPTVLEEAESLRREIASALQDRDRALKECCDLKAPQNSANRGKPRQSEIASALQDRDRALKECCDLKAPQNSANRGKPRSDRDRALKECCDLKAPQNSANRGKPRSDRDRALNECCDLKAPQNSANRGKPRSVSYVPLWN
ncbi:unnamed protein product [Plutella xylostella]|uniref:(diamondback moth) hypothetical protein n=1 Tax=Plutella xylostella TaxID=51655 RepID=A0A8S4FS29_PLUXY|nr:unnamed protein product [Plutella xylostella]